jgi:hypothetical protein
MNLRVRVVRRSCGGARPWYADVDDAGDPQPDNPYWYVDRCDSQATALELACAALSRLDAEVRQGRQLVRVLDSRLVAA